MKLTSQEYLELVAKSAKPNKYNARRKVLDDVSFASKLEARFFARLKLLQQAGEISYFLMQTRFDLCKGLRYYCDFTCFYPDGTVRYFDVKGCDTRVSINKRKMVAALYPVEIELITKKDF